MGQKKSKNTNLPIIQQTRKPSIIHPHPVPQPQETEPVVISTELVVKNHKRSKSFSYGVELEQLQKALEVRKFEGPIA